MDINKYIQMAQKDVSYNEAAKAVFLRESKKMLKELADCLGLVKGEYDLRVNQGGIAVSGEVTLHSDRIYVQVQQGSYMPILYRSCQYRKDYTGGLNRWLDWHHLLNWEKFVSSIRNEMRK